MGNTARIFDNVFSSEEIAKLNKYYDKKEYTVIKTDHRGRLKYKNKNNDYNITYSIPYKIIHQKLTKLIGDHSMQYGAYLESHYPFLPHVDTNENFKDPSYYQHTVPLHTNISVLIPLSEHQDFNTIFWKYWVDEYKEGDILPIQTEQEADLGSILDHVEKDYDRMQLARLALDKIYNWKIGSLVVWDRNQLHAATDFTKSGLAKTAITLFL